MRRGRRSTYPEGSLRIHQTDTRPLRSVSRYAGRRTIKGVRHTITSHVLLVVRLPVAEPIEAVVHIVYALVVEIFPTGVLQRSNGMQC